MAFAACTQICDVQNGGESVDGSRKQACFNKNPGHQSVTGVTVAPKGEKALRFRYARGLQTFRPADNLEADDVAFVEGFVPVTDDFFEMHKDILASFACNKTEAFGSVEPLYCSFFHGTDPFNEYKSAAGGHGHRPSEVCQETKKKQPFRFCPWLRFFAESYGFVSWAPAGPAPVSRNAFNPTTMFK